MTKKSKKVNVKTQSILSQQKNLLDLPNEILTQIEFYLPLRDLCHFLFCCHQLKNQISNCNTIWKHHINVLKVSNPYKYLRGHNGLFKYRNCLDDFDIINHFLRVLNYSHNSTNKKLLIAIKNLGAQTFINIINYDLRTARAIYVIFDLLLQDHFVGSFNEQFSLILILGSLDSSAKAVVIKSITEIHQVSIFNRIYGDKNGHKLLLKFFDLVDDANLNERLAILFAIRILDQDHNNNCDPKLNQFYDICLSKIGKNPSSPFVDNFIQMVMLSSRKFLFNKTVKFLMTCDSDIVFNFVDNLFNMPFSQMNCTIITFLDDLLSHPDIEEINLTSLHLILRRHFFSFTLNYHCKELVKHGLSIYLERFPHLGDIDDYRRIVNNY